MIVNCRSSTPHLFLKQKVLSLMVIGNFINWIVWPPQSHFACASWSRGGRGGRGIARFSFHIFNAAQRKSNHTLFTKAVAAVDGTMRNVALLLLLFLGCTICLNFKKVNYCCNKSFQGSQVILKSHWKNYIFLIKLSSPVGFKNHPDVSILLFFSFSNCKSETRNSTQGCASLTSIIFCITCIACFVCIYCIESVCESCFFRISVSTIITGNTSNTINSSHASNSRYASK